MLFKLSVVANLDGVQNNMGIGLTFLDGILFGVLAAGVGNIIAELWDLYFGVKK